MNDIWYKLLLFALLLMFVIAPFAGFAPLLLVLLVAGAYWFFSSILQAFIYGKTESESDRS